MNLTSSIAANGCKRYQFSREIPNQHFSAGFNESLITIAIVNLISCPSAILLNALIIVAVKMKRRSQTNPNILLACLSITDLLVRLIVQPLHIAIAILLLLGKHYVEFCDVHPAFNVSFLISCGASLNHLVLISGERYFTRKHSFYYRTFVTKSCLMIVSALIWFVAVILFMIPKILVLLIVRQASTIFSIVVFQVLVYREAHRHKKQILANQVSLEDRTKFEREKKVLKLATTIIAAVVVSYATPVIILVVTKSIFSEESFADAKMAARELGFLPIVLNSVVNPVIYTERTKQFRIAFIELLIRKPYQEARAFERQLFGSTNSDVGPES